MTMHKAMSLAVLGLAILVRWQEPQPVSQDPVPTPATQKPVTPTTKQQVSPEQAAKVIGKAERSPLEGVYRLRSRVVNGVRDLQPSIGYLAITSRHLFLNLASPGPDDATPLLHSGVREWRKVGTEIRTTAKLDYYTDGAGEIFRIPEGKQEVRRIEIVLGGVRVIQEGNSWLEFERIE